MARRGRSRKRVESTTTEEVSPTSGVSILTLAKQEMKKLGKLNNKISDFQDDAWIRKQIEKLKEKRDAQEGLAAVAINAAREKGFEVTPWGDVDGEELPKMPAPKNWPRDLPVRAEVNVQEQDLPIQGETATEQPPHGPGPFPCGGTEGCEGQVWHLEEDGIYQCDSCSRFAENPVQGPWSAEVEKALARR